jgi:hypothetical protein
MDSTPHAVTIDALTPQIHVTSELITSAGRWAAIPALSYLCNPHAQTIDYFDVTVTRAAQFSTTAYASVFTRPGATLL